LETTSQSDDSVTVVTDLTWRTLQSFHHFATRGLLPASEADLKDELIRDFLALGVNLARLNLVPDFDQSNLEPPELELKSITPIIIKTEQVWNFI
jgi:hypothetical protein